EVMKLVKHCTTLSNINLVGLMTMAPLTDDEKIIRKSFADLRNLKDEINQNGFDLGELSMGMTNDFEIAIEEGATMLRIGSAIFGQRNNITDWRQS
ncbi:MAG: alanine racemase, partial [Ignavibacteriaceae bacterium]|nr:alanine racemase [Ignavibacteriaceae bacterium]